MVAMPYILVGIVLSVLSLILFCTTSAALLSAYPKAAFYLPAHLRHRRWVAFLAHTLALLALLLAALQVSAWLWQVNLFNYRVSDPLFLLGLLNSAILVYLFLDRRYLLGWPTLQRRLLFGTLALAGTLAAGIAIIILLTVLFVIR